MNARHVFICPACAKGSASDKDAEDGYCGQCHAQTGVPVRLSVGVHTTIVGHLARESPVPLGTRLCNLLVAVGKEFEAAGLQFLPPPEPGQDTGATPA